MRMGGPGWRGGRRGEGDGGFTTETEGGEQETLYVRWINPDEGDDIAASKLLCGWADGGSLTTKEGWFRFGGRDKVPGYIGPGPRLETHGRCRSAGAYLTNVVPRYLALVCRYYSN